MIKPPLSSNFDWIQNIELKNQFSKENILAILKKVEEQVEKDDFDISTNVLKVLEHTFIIIFDKNNIADGINRIVNKFKPEAEVLSALKSIQKIGNENKHANKKPKVWGYTTRDAALSLLRDIWICLIWIFQKYDLVNDRANLNLEFNFEQYLDPRRTTTENHGTKVNFNASMIPAQTIGLVDFVMNKDNQFYIPHYQREYTWDKYDINNFFQDTKKRILDKRTHHMGVLALAKNKGDKTLRVVDGQQRITTVLLILSAFNELFKQKNIKSNTNIFNDWDKNIEDKYKNVSNEKFNDIYNILKLDYPTKQSTQAQMNFNTIKQEIRTMERNDNISFEEQFQTIKDQFVISFFEYTSLDVKGELEAFENINSKGKTLNESDLIENLMIHSIRNEDLEEERKIRNIIDRKIKKVFAEYNIKATKTNWDNFYSYINDIEEFAKDNKEVSLDQNVKKHKVYNRFKLHWNPESNLSIKSFEEKIDNLNLDLHMWCLLESKKYNEEQVFFGVKHSMNAIMNKKVHYPLITFIIKNTCKFEGSKVKTTSKKTILEHCIKIIEIYLVRLLVTRGTGQSMLGIFNQALRSISKAKVQNYPKILWDHFNQLEKNKLPSVKEFEKAIISNQTFDATKWTHEAILIAIENYLLNIDNKHKNQNLISTKNIEVEHILPKKPKGPKFENYNSIIEQIGNKCILDSDTNKKISNKSFEEKQAEYPKHNIFLINGIDKSKVNIKLTAINTYKTFGAKQIKKRTEEIAKVAITGPYKDIEFNKEKPKKPNS